MTDDFSTMTGVASAAGAGANTAVAAPSGEVVQRSGESGADRAGAALDGAEAARVAERIARRLFDQLGPERFALYFGGEQPIRLDEAGLVVRVPTGFLAEQLQRRFEGLIRESAAAAGLMGGWPAGGGPAGSGGVVPGVRYEVGTATGAGAGAGGGMGAGAGASGGAGGGSVGGRFSGVPAPVVMPGATRAVLNRRAGGAAESSRRWAELSAFVPSPGTRLAWEVSQRVAASPRAWAGKPVVVHGPCGQGKTHLLEGVVVAARRGEPGLRARLVTGEAFANEFIGAIKSKSVDAFRRAFRGLDLLALDDLHTLAGKTATQAELLHTLDALSARGAAVIVGAPGPVRSIARLSEGLASRLSAGVSVELGEPDEACLEKLAVALAKRQGLTLEPLAARALAQAASVARGAWRGGAGGAARGPTRAGPGEAPARVSVRDLEGLVLRVDAVHRLMDWQQSGGNVLGLGTVRRALEAGAAGAGGGPGSLGGVRKPVAFGAILAASCEELGVSAEQVLAGTRTPGAVAARAIAAHAAREVTSLSYPEIARELARPNHSTVITAVQRVRKQIEAGEAAPVRIGMHPRTLAAVAERVIARVRGV